MSSRRNPLTSKWWWPGREDAVLLFQHHHVVQDAGAHGLCVLILLNYALFPGKSSVVCRSCSADTECTSTPGCRSHGLTSISFTCPILFYHKARLSCSPTCQLHQEPSASPLSFSFRPTCCSSGLSWTFALALFQTTISSEVSLKIIFIFREVHGSGDLLVQG